ncbi:MAG: PHP domain-containing protein [Eubacterium sp.]|nr:PHP domain-containing protein [Eubacterium sp.]
MKNEFKYELHCHTGCVSRCGRTEPEEIVKLYIDKGYDGIVVTDHYSPMTFKKNWCPQTQIDFYLQGYRRMKAAAPENFTVLLGMELRHYATGNDYLIYGVEEDFLYSAGNLLAALEKKVYTMCKERGYLVFQAHPFRPYIIRCNPKYLDGIEVYNGKVPRSQNERALAWAKKTGKLMCSGSDFHEIENLAKGGIITSSPIKTNEDLLSVLKSQDFKRIETY